MAWTQADLDALDAVIAEAATSVHWPDGAEVRRPDIADLKQRRALMADSLAAQVGTQTTRLLRLGDGGKGFC